MPDHAMKRCRRCGSVKPDGQFTRDRSKRDGRRSICRDCDHSKDRLRYQERRDAKLEYQRQYYEANGQAVRDYQQRYRDANPDKISERDRRYREANHEAIAERQRQYEDANREKVRERQRLRARRHRDAVLDHYGRACTCPGCYSTERLCIDHINGGGREHRAEIFRGQKRGPFDFWLIKQGFPEGYQTLCARCNTSKGTGQHCRLDHDLEFDVENDAW